MASNVYFKSVVYLVSVGVLAYSLLILTKPSEEKLSKIKATTAGVHLSEDEKKKILFLKKLREAANQKEATNLEKRNN